MKKLPSIKLLVTFDAAARHLSFKQAAEELCVTPSAVGHQVRVLEKELNIALFIRLNRSIELTPEGKDYHQKISKALRTLHKATEELTAQNNPKTFLVHSIPFITNTVLAPHIKSFKALYPDVAISIESKIDRVDINDAMLQIALRHGSDDSDGLIYDKICDVQISPICTPDYLKQDKKTLLQLSTDSTSWDIWNSDWNTKIDFDDTLYCDGMQAIVEMAAQGLGITMGYFPAIHPLLNDGSIVLAYPEKISHVKPLYLAYSADHQNNKMIQDFAAWLRTIFDSFTQ